MNRQLVIVWLMTCLLLWLATWVHAQTTITLTGSVADAATGKAMPFANVYLNGTTRGTLTDDKGHYSLTGVPLGTVEIVASFVGYEPQRRTLRINNSQDNKANFRLKPSEQTLLTVTVRGNQKRWERHLRQFKRQLLGEPFGGQCLLVNPDVLSFKEEAGHLKATATEPLIIENQALGYRLKYDLLLFDGSFQKVYFSGSAYFEEIKATDERQARRFRRNRMLAYKGSTRHLMASIINGNYEQEGFMVFQENTDVLPMRTLSSKIVLAGSIATDSTRGHLQPLKLNKLIQPGRLPFERQLVSDKKLIVFYTLATSGYSPYTDARYAYSEIQLPMGQMQLTVDGTITLPYGMTEYGSLADDRLSTMLPADWLPTKNDADPTKSAPVLTQGRFLLPDARQERIAKAFTERFHALAPVLFVHNDKPFYATGDRVWLSVYMLDAVTNLRPLGETAIHVDLLTPNGKLVQHQWLRLSDGRAAGNLRLADTLSSGTYRLRAYTDEDDGQYRPAFERSIAVYNLVQSTPPKQATTDPKPIDIQVLPEGGQWVVGLSSRLGIKLVDPDGHGVSASGRIVTDGGTEICLVKTNALGIGSFEMIPEAGKKYYADITYAGQHQLVPLPKAEEEGLLLSVDVLSDTSQLALTITSKNSKILSPVDSVYILVQQRGHLVDQRKILLQNGVARVSLPVEPLPPGLIQITLYDAAARPRAERLVFLQEQVPPVRVIIDANKARFKPRERAVLSFHLNDEGLPAMAVLSASVSDATQVPDDTAEATFQTHLLLTGELRGRVERPNFYLKDHTLETRRALDDLLLTQGWRRVKGTSSTELLGGVSISGRILNAKNQPIPGSQIFFASTVPGQSFVKSAGTDEKGRFRLAGLDIADTIQLMTQLTDHQLKDLPEKDAHLVLEGPDSSWQPDTIALPSNWSSLRAQLEAARIRQESDADLYRDKTVKVLKAVTVKARRFDERPDDIQSRSLHNSADAVLVFDDKSPPFSNLYEMMRGRVAGVAVTQNPITGSYKVVIRGTGSFMGGTTPLYLMDGMNIQDNDGTGLMAFNPAEIERIEFLKNGGTTGIYGIRGGNGVIAFYTKRFRPEQPKSDAKKGMKPMQLIGYQAVQREFYVPRYDTETQAVTISGKVDRRDVLYWKPLMQTDSEGHSQLVFPLSDVVQTLRVTVQGITATGRPVVAVKLIRVQ